MHPSMSNTKITADPNMGFGPSPYNRPVVPYQQGTISSMAGMPHGAINNFGGINAAIGTMMAGNVGVMENGTVVAQIGIASNMFPDPVPGLRCDPGVAVHWSFEEQAILRDGLVNYAGLPNIMKYIKIAAMLREKTVRDIALRCRWMNRKENGKRRKPEEQYTGKKIKDGKKVESSLNANVPLYHDISTANCSRVYPLRPRYQLSSEDPGVDSATKQLMDENVHFMHQIAANLAELKIQENVDLLSGMRNNIATTLNNMSEMSGIMSRMPPLPEPLNEGLFSELHNLNKMFALLGRRGSSH